MNVHGAPTFTLAPWTWNLAKVRAAAETQTAPVTRIPVDVLGGMAGYLIEVPVDAVDAVTCEDLGRPLLAVTVPRDGEQLVVVVDGWDQVLSAAGRGVLTLPVLLVDCPPDASPGTDGP